jgi:DNA-binding SARP family transcriptional activator
VHREVLLESLWPDATPEGGTRNLQVAVSSLRHVLGRALGNPPPLHVERNGDAYRLAVTAGTSVDLVEFDQAAAAARGARASGDAPAAIAALERMLDLYIGDLLPEDGPAEWVVGVRERRRWEAAGAARMLAEYLLEQDNPGSAARACEWGLLVDPYQDALWRLLISAHEHVPNPLAAGKARRRYQEVLQGLECVT